MSYFQSEHVKITNPQTDIDKAYKIVDSYIADAGITGKNKLRIRLLSEEVLRLLKSVVGLEETEFFIEGDSRVARICLTAANHLGKDKQQELLSMSTSGENAAQQGFFGTLLSMFSFNDYEETTWSLKEHEDEIRRRRDEDACSAEAWEDLERSLVANLADDIEVGISKGRIKLIASKDMSESLGTVGSRTPRKVTGCAFTNSARNDEDRFFDEADKMIEELKVSKKDAIHLKLLVEEVAGMLKAMTTEYQAMFWFELYKEECCVKLTGKTTMDITKKQDLIDVSSNRKNNAVNGVMGKIGDVIENGLLSYASVSKLSQTYGGACINYGAMGIYGGTPDSMYPGVMWSLRDYRNSLNAAVKEDSEAAPAWDELERSIVANVAKDILVSVKGNRIDMTAVYDLQG